MWVLSHISKTHVKLNLHILPNKVVQIYKSFFLSTQFKIVSAEVMKGSEENEHGCRSTVSGVIQCAVRNSMCHHDFFANILLTILYIT